MKTFLIIIPIIALAVLGVIFYDGIMLDKICQDDGGKRIGDVCKIPVITNSTQNSDVYLPKIKTMKPDSMEIFFYPDPKGDKDHDAYNTFMLIRLPEWMGGGAQDASAFRAYSSLAVDDHCMVKYWAGDGRQRIENPCRGGFYRAIDGIMTIPFDPISDRMIALPHLKLSNDQNGILYIEPPKWTKTENGVIGYGKEVTMEDIHKGSEQLRSLFAKSHPEFPVIPLNFVGYTLADIGFGNAVKVTYLDFTSKFGMALIEIQKCENEDCTVYLPYSESWKIDDTVMLAGGSAYDKNSTIPEEYREYTILFAKDGYKFLLTGNNLDIMKRDIVSNYFPQYTIDDLIMIPK